MGHDLSTDAGWTAALDEVVGGVVSLRRQIAALEAQQARALSSAVDLVSVRTAHGRAAGKRVSRADLAAREVAAELGTAMRIGDRTVQLRMGDAVTLTTRFTSTLVAWEDGRIDAAHVGAILDAGAAILDDGARARFEDAVLLVAEVESAGRLRGIARAIAATLEPETASERHRRAVDERRVRRMDLGDGMGRLIADLPAVLVEAGFDRLTQMARTVVTGEDPLRADEAVADAAAFVTRPTADADFRTMEQIRADVFADLLLAGAPAAHGEGDALAAITGHVQVTVPVLSAIGVGSEPFLLAGHGPIDADTALKLAGHAVGWDRVLTHPLTGAVLAVDRYRASESLRRHLRARDERCRFPGCQRTAIRADADHTIDAARGGATCASNLGHLCRRHHTLKHHTAWTVRQRNGGVIEWFSPTGRGYVDRPPATVRFVPTDWLERILAGPTTGEPVAPF